MQETYAAIVERVVERVESGLDGTIGLDELSREACLSKYQLHRLFRALTGYPLAEYARMRRLSASVDPLVRTDRAILDIALDFGFSFEQSYIRAFKAAYGMSPGQCRSEKPLLRLTERIRQDAIVPVGQDGALFESTLVARPAMVLCGTRHSVTDEKNAAENSVARIANEFFLRDRSRVKSPYYKNRYVGVVEYGPDPSKNEYLTCVELKKKPVTPPSDGMEYAFAPARRYREFLHVSRKSPFEMGWEDVKAMYGYIFGVWMPTNGAELAEMRHFEYVDLSDVRDGYGEFHVLLPVKD